MTHYLRTVSVGALLLILAACGGEPIDPTLIDQPGEIPPGPGILTGETGSYQRSL